MKTIIENESKLSKFLLKDETVVELTEKTIKFNNIVVCDLNTTNSSIIGNVTAPEDWAGNKYTYENGVFVLNPKWVDPKVRQAEIESAIKQRREKK